MGTHEPSMKFDGIPEEEEEENEHLCCEQNQHFAELRHTWYVYTSGSAPKRFAKFGWQTQTF